MRFTVTKLSPIAVNLTKYSKGAYISGIKTPWPLVRERTIPTERPPLVEEI
jgi:hypothetical protein